MWRPVYAKMLEANSTTFASIELAYVLATCRSFACTHLQQLFLPTPFVFFLPTLTHNLGMYFPKLSQCQTIKIGHLKY